MCFFQIRIIQPPQDPDWAAQSRAYVFAIVNRPEFEYVITSMILLNVLVMCMSFHGEPSGYTVALSVINDVFAFIFLLEVFVKWFGLGITEYFKSSFNLFDFTIVAVSLVTFVLRMVSVFASGIDPVVFRVFRVLRVFRLLIKAEGLKRMITTLLWSFSALSNILLILFLITFIFAVAGVSLFGLVKHGNFLNHHANFENFFNAFTTLVRMMTGESETTNMKKERDVSCISAFLRQWNGSRKNPNSAFSTPLPIYMKNF